MNIEKTNRENRKHKDSLFVDYFSKDRDWKQHFLSLYNALHGTNLQVETTNLERVNLEQVLYMDYYNDIAVMVNGQFILMIEHQSTINPNMPLRLLEYISRIYGNLVDSKAKFSNQPISLAKPEFIVFYTGKENIPPESYLCLSDAFTLSQPKPSELTLELKVKVCKISSEEPSPVVGKCLDLAEYAQFLRLIDEARVCKPEAPLTWAIQEAVRRNLMKDYLERRGGEALSILTAEYSFDVALAVREEEAYSIGRDEGISIGLEQGAHEKALETAKAFLAMGLSPEQVAQGTNLPLETVLELAQ